MNVRRSFFPAALAGALAVQASLHVWFAVSHSATFDEPSYIAAGMALWTTGVDRQMFVHPPLAKRVAGFAALVAGADPAGAGDDRMGAVVLYRTNAGRAGRLLLAARLATMLAALALTIAVASWAREWWGDGAGALAAWLLAVEPNTLAHGGLATTDIWLTLWLILYARTLWSFLEGSGHRCPRETGGALAGLALGTKFSALAFIPAITVAMAAAVAARGRTVAPLKRLLRAAPRTLFVAALVLFAIYALQIRVFEPGYGRGGPGSWWPIGLTERPDLFLRLGLGWVARYARTGVPAFFLGAVREGRLPAYFPVVFALKVPLGLIGLAVLAVGWRLSVRRFGIRELGLALAFLAIFASVAASRLHVGLRHVHPAVVLAVLLAASLVGPGLPSPRWRRALALAGWLWSATTAGRCAPHFLASFNELAGGPGGGWRYLADSNLDWGQDLPALARWCRDRGVTSLPLIYFGVADPGWYGVPVSAENPESRDWRGGLVAISVSYLDGTLTNDLERFGWARALTPVARPGWSIHVYQAPPRPRPPRSTRARAGTAPGSRPRATAPPAPPPPPRR
ncbi:MAG: phospholipid carrier-dependent glycosyltransferase [Candidatus Coatesbacteria bacterium]